MDKNFDTTLSAALHAAADAAHAADASGARTRGRQRAMRKRIVVSTLSLALAATCVAAFAATAAPHRGGTPQKAAASPTATSAPTTDSAVRACGNGDLLVWGGPSRSAGAHTGVFLVVTNESRHACFVQGYPTVVIGGTAEILERATPVLNGYLGDGGPLLTSTPKVVLAPKASAKAMLENTPGGVNTCQSTGTGGLTVTAPGTTTAVGIGGPYPINVHSCPDLKINPLVADPNAGPPAG